MRKKRKRKLNKLALGGALIIGALFIFYLSGVWFVCKQDGGQLVKNNPTSILLWISRLSCPLNKPQTSFAKQWLNKPEPKASVSLLNISQNWGVGILIDFVKLMRGLPNPVLAYDQQNTHPALTDEAVDFYNLNFPDNQLSQEDRALLIRGVIEEDVPPRYLNHFYDPVYNKSWSDYTTSKEWALNSATQQSFTDAAFSYGGFANLFSDNLSPTDFSYPRALHDYAIGKRDRAMLAMGHILHLLEDANVPEHTRGDIHLWWHGTESPYEKTMAKWNPGNIDIANELFQKPKKPILLSQLGDYFDEIANYSNNYFFSEDTIFIERYSMPTIDFWKYQEIDGELLAIGYKNENGTSRPLVGKLGKSKLRNLATENYFTLNLNLILDDYWARLAPDFVAHGAGALKLFLEQAELVKQEYVKEMQKVSVSSDWIGRFLSFLGFSGSGIRPVTFNPEFIQSIISQPKVLGALTDILNGDNDVNDDSNTLNDVSNDVGNDDNDVGGSPTPSVTSTPEVEPPQEVQPQNQAQNQETPTPSPTPLFYSGSGGSGGGSSSNNATPTPSPSLTPIPTETQEVEPPQESEVTPTPSDTPPLTPSDTPTPTPTSEPTPSPSETPTLTPTPTPTGTPVVEPPQEVQPLMQIVINEIGWMGTGGTATLSNDEWLELYNPTSSPVDVSGWQLKSLIDNSPDITLAPKTIEPYGFFLLERTNDGTISDISANQVYTGNLNDSGEILELRDGDGNLMDFVGSLNASGQADSWYAGDKTTRSSMERIEPLGPGDEPANWVTNNGLVRNGKNAAGDFINGTPGAKNSAYISQKPSAITDLVIDLASSFFDKIKLLWSAPKDEDTPAAGLKYEIRYSASSFNNTSDWTGAVVAADFSVPKPIADFGHLQSASFSLFDFSGWVPPDLKILPFNFTVSPKVASDCKEIKAIGWYRDLPHPDTDLIAIYNTDSGEFRMHYSRGPHYGMCNFSYELPRGHYSAVIEHGSACHTNFDRYVYLPYSECKKKSGFEGEVLFTVSDREFVYGQPYYFAIKTYDGGQWSDTSNQAEYTAKSAIFDDSDAIPGPANPSVQWTFQTPNVLRLGQPAVAPDGTVYVSAPSYDFGRKLRLYAVNQDGSEKWYWENGLAEPSELAVSADGAVYFGQFDPGSYVTALNPDGSTRWQYGIGDRVNNVSIDGRGNVYFTSENRLITKVQPNGKKKWEVFDNFTFGFTSLVDVDDDVYIGADISGLPGLYKLNGDDGSMIWQTRVSDNFIYSQFDPVYDSDQDQFFSTAANYGQILTFNKEGGDTTKNVIDIQGSPSTKVTILGNSLVFGMDFSFNRPASGSLVYAVDKVNKSVIWTYAVDSRVNNQITADSEGNMYFATRSGNIYSLAADGRERWVLDLETPTDSYPVLWNGSLFISAGEKLFKISD